MRLQQTQQNTLAVNGEVFPADDIKSNIIVRSRIIVDTIEDVTVCQAAWSFFNGCRFTKRVRYDDGSMDAVMRAEMEAEMSKEEPYTLHIIKNGFKCIPDKVLASAITLRFDNVGENLSEAIPLAGATDMRVLVLVSTIMAKINFEYNLLLAFIKLKDNTESPNALHVCEQLKKFPCLLRVDIDNWNGQHFKDIIQKSIYVGSKLEIVLRHEKGHVFKVLSYNQLVKVLILPSAYNELKAIFKSVISDCPVKIHLSIWIIGEAHKKNDCSILLNHMGSSKKMVQKLACVNFDVDGFEFLKNNHRWMSKKMPDLELLHCTINVIGDKWKQSLRKIAKDLQARKWPKNLKSFGLIVPHPNDEMKDWEMVVPTQIYGTDCVIFYFGLEDNLDTLFSSVKETYDFGNPKKVSEVSPKVSPFLHSRQCIVTRTTTEAHQLTLITTR